MQLTLEIKIYNEADDSKTAAALVFHAKFSNAANHGQSHSKFLEKEFTVMQGMYVDLTNCDFLVRLLAHSRKEEVANG